MGAIPGIEQKYQYGQYGQYGQGAKIPFGGLTVQPRVTTPTPSVDNPYGIAIPQNYSYTTSENGDKIATGQDGVGLAHRDAKDYNFMLIA